MIQIRAGDLVAVSSAGQVHYALILDRIRLFGGNWTFAFHTTSDSILDAESVLKDHRGFNAFVDFIWAKREARVQRLARGVDVTPYFGPGFLKNTHTIQGEADFWFIYDMEGHELRRVRDLSAAERAYPLDERIDDLIMSDRIRAEWTPEKDDRIRQPLTASEKLRLHLAHLLGKT